MNTDLRRSKRYADFLPISVVAVPGGDNAAPIGPFSGRIIDISRHGACLLMTQVLQKNYHVYHSSMDNKESILELHINVPPELRKLVIPCRPVWISPFQVEEIKAFRMGVDFLINPEGEKMQRLEKELMKKQKERDELWSSLATPLMKK
ncbi:MAG TPA: PilZ domain-containing protein [Desulfobacteraceae bacterium]|nr:PilZ domain-containing protein [Desulfobacteraceae bacterium]